jgi:hypothetical protein
MKAELVKREDHWALYNEDGHKIAATIDGCNSKLSIKNCEAIANGYDLDELASERLSTRFDENSGYHKFVFVEAYKEGFLKAMEILGDKKFSINDMEKLMFATLEFTDTQEEGETYPFFKSFIQSLQQTEWDVEIVTKPYTEVGEGFELESKREPKLDKDGCLILKRL